MSFIDQLSSSKVSFTNTFDINTKKKKSLIYEDGASLSRAQAFTQCRQGFDDLCVYDKKFLKFENLFLESDIDKPIALLNEEEITKIKLDIRHFLFMLTDYLETKYALLAIEWLIFKYDAHIHQPEDILISCLPLHDRPVFIKFIRLFNFKQKEFSWLQSFSETGRVLNLSELSTSCLKHPDLLEMICGWPVHILEVCNNDANSCKKICRVIFCLALNILEKVQLKGSDKIAKHISPFTRFICDGFSSTISEFMSVASMILVYLSHQIELDKVFLRDCIKKLLRSDVIENYTCLRVVIDLVSSQDNFTLSDKLENLLTVKVEKLDKKNKRSIESLLSEVKGTKVESMDVEESNIKIEDVDVKMECDDSFHTGIQLKKSHIVEKFLADIVGSIDWTSENIENKLIDLISTHVLTWYHTKETNISVKLAQELLKLIKNNSKKLKIVYRHGGLISYLCVAIISPNYDIRRAAKRLITKVAVGWSHINVISAINSSVLSSDYGSLFFGEVGKLLLSEIDAICCTGALLTIQKEAMKLINTHTLQLATSLPNVWKLFLDGVSPSNGILNVKESAFSALFSVKESFSCLETIYQNAIIDAVTSDLNGSHELLSTVTVNLSKVNLSLHNYQYLLRDVIWSNGKSTKKTTKKISSRLESKDPRDECIRGDGKYRVLVTLGALNLGMSLSPSDLIQLIHPIFIIIERVLKVNEDTNKDDMVYLLSNLMSAVLTILSSIETILDSNNKDSLDPVINIEDLTQCIYKFNNTNLNNLILMVIEKLARLDLGLAQFSIIYFMDWLGKHILPRDDQHSMDILNSVLELILPATIKARQYSDDLSSNIKIIASFVKDCIDLPKHRALLLYFNLVKNLSGNGSNVLWIQLIFMAIRQPSNSDRVIVKLMEKFSKEEQLKTIKQVVCFLVKYIRERNDTNKKRKFMSAETTDSPREKKRRMSSGKEISVEKLKCCNNEEKEFASVREHLISTEKNIDCAVVLQTMIRHFLIQLRENQLDMSDVTSDVLTDMISGLFGSMKVLGGTNESLLPIQTRNELVVSIREVIEALGASLVRTTYLGLVVDLAMHDDDDTVKLKSLELLANKLSAMAEDKRISRLDDEMLALTGQVLEMCKGVIGTTIENESVWIASVSCVTSLLSLGCMSQGGEVKTNCEEIFDRIVALVDQGLTGDILVLVNVFLLKYVATVNEQDLNPVFLVTIKSIEVIIKREKLNGDDLESCLALIHGLVSREDSERSLGWNNLERLASTLFDLTSIAVVIRQMSKSSLIYHKNIRGKLSKMRDSASLIEACTHLVNSGLTQANVTYVSGGISLFGCHLDILNKRGVKWTVESSGAVWPLVIRLLSLGEFTGDEATPADHYGVCETMTLKSLTQLCVLCDYDQDLVARMISWAQEATTLVTVVTRYTIIYRLMSHVTKKSKNASKAMSFINESGLVPLASSLLRHLVADRDSKKKKKRKTLGEDGEQVKVVIGYAREQCVSECPEKCLALVEAVCGALNSHLVAEHRANMNLEVCDDTVSLIGSVCATLTSVEEYTDSKERYMTTATTYVAPLITQMAMNSFNDDSLLTPIAMGLCKYFSELPSHVHLAVLKVIAGLKEGLEAAFDSCIRDKVSSFLEDCKLHDDETIADLANDI